MNILQKCYRWIHDATSRPEERGEYSSGRWQDEVRTRVRHWVGLEQGAVLEVGCGEALFLTRLAKDHPDLQLYGIDHWEEILARAQSRLDEGGVPNVSLSLADAARMPYADGFFDLVICVNVIFNLPSADKFDRCLTEMARVCRAGGRIILDIRNKENPLLFWKYKLAKYYDDSVKNLPLMTYRLADVTSLVESKGFRVVRVCSVGFPANRWAPIFVIEAFKEGKC